MADFLSQFIGKDETPSVEFKHRRGNRKVSDSTKIVKDEAQEVSTALKSLEDLFDKHVPTEGMADSLGGELLRAYFHLLYRAENDGDVPLRGYGNITCNSSFRFLNDYFHGLGVEGDFVRYSPFYDEWSTALRNFAPELLAELMAYDGNLFHIDNTIDSREVSDEDYDMESADAEEGDDEDWIEDSAGHRCRKCDVGKMSHNFKVSDSSRGGRGPAFTIKSHKDSTKKVKDAEGDRFYTKRAYLADKEDIERIISESNPILEYAGGGSGIMGRTITFTVKGRDDLNYIDVPITKATTLAELAELISPDNLPHPTEFVEDSTKKVSDAEGDGDDDDFEDEPEREFTDEEIIDFARNHDGFGYELYEEAYRDKGHDDDLWETMDRLDDVIVDQPASWLLDRMFYGDFNPRHAYWKFNGYGNLESFDGSFESLFDKHIDETVMVEYIRDNMDKYREYLEEYFEDDED